MIDHRKWQEEIAAYAASRLQGESLRRFESHIGECPECRELAGTWKEIAACLRAGGGDLFEPHPGVLELGQFAQGETTGGVDRIRTHLAGCETCALEVEAWKGRPDPVRAHSGKTDAWPHRFLFGALSVAAGLILGLGLHFLVLEPRIPESWKLVPAGVSSGEIGSWSGAARHLLLPRIQRGEAGSLTFAIGREEPFVVVDFQIPRLPGDAASGSYRFEIVRSDGTVTWSSVLAASEIRPHQEAMELISFVVPTKALPPDRYDFRVFEPGETGPTPWYRVPAEIVFSDP